MRKLVQRSAIAGLAALALACSAVIALGRPSSHPPKAATPVFPASAPVADDPVLVAAITRGGPPLPSTPVKVAHVEQKAPAPLYQTIDLETGPDNDGLAPVGRTQADAAVTENAASPVEPETSAMPPAD